MFGIAVATLSAPAITNTVLGNGYDINAVFAIGAFSAALALISLILLEREIKKEKVKCMSDSSLSGRRMIMSLVKMKEITRKSTEK